MGSFMKLFFVFSLIGALFACGSTDGAGRIAVNTMEGGDWEVAVFDLETQVLHMVTDNTVFDWGGTWSPDGTRLAFATNYLKGEVSEILLRDANGVLQPVVHETSGEQDIVVTPDRDFSLTHLTTNSAVDDEPAWSPDGQSLAFSSYLTGNAEIFTMDADGSNVVQLTDSLGENWHPDWSPDGSRIAFTSKSDLTGGVTTNWELFVMDANGGNVKQLTRTEENEWRPVWSPDGERLAFARLVPGTGWDVFVMDANGGNIVQLTDSADTNFEPVWSPDGSRLAFASNRSGEMEVYLMDADGARIQRLGLVGIPSDWTEHG